MSKVVPLERFCGRKVVRRYVILCVVHNAVVERIKTTRNPEEGAQDVASVDVHKLTLQFGLEQVAMLREVKAKSEALLIQEKHCKEPH